MKDHIGQVIELGDVVVYIHSKGFAQGLNLGTVSEIHSTLPEGRLTVVTSKGAKVVCKPKNTVVYRGYEESLCLPE